MKNFIKKYKYGILSLIFFIVLTIIFGILHGNNPNIGFGIPAGIFGGISALGILILFSYAATESVAPQTGGKKRNMKKKYIKRQNKNNFKASNSMMKML